LVVTWSGTSNTSPATVVAGLSVASLNMSARFTGYSSEVATADVYVADARLKAT
jgi:hypothetical protein